MNDVLRSINKRLSILEDMNKRLVRLEARNETRREYLLKDVHEITGKSVYSLAKHCRLGTLNVQLRQNRDYHIVRGIDA